MRYTRQFQDQLQAWASMHNTLVYMDKEITAKEFSEKGFSFASPDYFTQSKIAIKKIEDVPGLKKFANLQIGILSVKKDQTEIGTCIAGMVLHKPIPPDDKDKTNGTQSTTQQKPNPQNTAAAKPVTPATPPGSPVIS